MSAAKPIPLDLSNLRYWRQNARMAVRDLYDALNELITNADDRYVVLGKKGRIEIEVERRRKGVPSIVRVRDFADGMTIETMKKKLARVGDRVSGMAEGKKVRGTNSRGAKDVAILGGATFESIAEDGRYHKCAITDGGYFKPDAQSPPATAAHRRHLGIRNGSGTVVTLEVRSEIKVPQHEKLGEQLGKLVPLRDIVSSPEREVILTDVIQGRKDIVSAPRTEGHEARKERFSIPGYSAAEAKLVIKRSARPIENTNKKFREGGILIKSSHAIHEATLFAPELEHDPHAAWFFGKLTCDYIDDLWNDYDDRLEQGEKPTPENPIWIFDPLRQAGLTREHPFVKALFREALKRLRPLVEEERKRQERSQARIESASTRQRLRLLELEAARFMNRYQEQEETSREPDDRLLGGQFRQKGYSLNPPFAQLVLGQGTRFWLNVNQEVFPELSEGDVVEIGCATAEISANKRFAPLEQHPNHSSVLRTVWTVKAERATPATAVSARVGPIAAETTVEVLEKEREKYTYVTALTFSSKHYSVRKDYRKGITILCPLDAHHGALVPLEVTCDHRAFTITGDCHLIPRPELGVSICRLRVSASESDCTGTLVARAAGQECQARVQSREPLGATIKIEIIRKPFRRATGTTKRSEARRGENAATLLSTSPAERSRFQTVSVPSFNRARYRS